MSNIGQKIKNRRIELGLTVDQLARCLQKSRATIYRYESTDTDNMPIGVLEPLAKALSITPAELMGWSGDSVKVTTKMTFDDNSSMRTLTQAYLRHPSVVQDEIIRRLEGLDATFSHNVNKLLQTSGDINGFINGTGLAMATVGKFMQGETVLTTPVEAEQIATYFQTDVVDLFFNDSAVQTKKKPVQKTVHATTSADNNLEAYYEYSEYAATFIKVADLEWPNDILNNRHKEFLDVLRLKNFDMAIKRLPDELDTERAAKVILDNLRDFYVYTDKHNKAEDIANFIISRAVG